MIGGAKEAGLGLVVGPTGSMARPGKADAWKDQVRGEGLTNLYTGDWMMLSRPLLKKVSASSGFCGRFTCWGLGTPCCCC